MSKYNKYVITELKTPDTALFTPEAKARYASFARRILWIDKDTVPGAFQMNCSWYLKTLDKGPPPHEHDEDEILGFFGNDATNPYDLHGEVEFWLGDEKQTIKKSAMVFIPGRMKHCPLLLKRVDRPIFHFSVVTGGQWIMRDVKHEVPKSEFRKYVVTELKEPEERKKIAPVYNKYARRVLWIDEDVVPGAFNMNVSWYLKAGTTIDDKPHTHEHDELIGFFSNDASKPNDLGGEIEIWLEDEQQIINKSCMIFVPAGMKHCPLILRKVGRPIFHFTVVRAGRYIKNEDLI